MAAVLYVCSSLVVCAMFPLDIYPANATYSSALRQLRLLIHIRSSYCLSLHIHSFKRPHHSQDNFRPLQQSVILSCLTSL